MKTIKLIDAGYEGQVQELRTHYMSLLAHQLLAIMKNEHPVESICCVKFIYPHMSMVKLLFKVVDSDGKDLSEEVFAYIEKAHEQLVKEGVLA